MWDRLAGTMAELDAELKDSKSTQGGLPLQAMELDTEFKRMGEKFVHKQNQKERDQAAKQVE